jgi:hypothetical protein
MTSPGTSLAGPAVTVAAVPVGFLVSARAASSTGNVTELVDAAIVLAAFLGGGWLLVRWPFRHRSRYERAPRIRRRRYGRRFRRNHYWREW